jgi:hypothetical protein
MTATYLIADNREPDYWLNDDPASAQRNGLLVDLSEDFISRYDEANRLYDGIQAELELIYKSKEV